MDIVTLTGVSAFIAAILVFHGSVWLLLSLVLGRSLAYWVTASIVFSFVTILAVVWSINPLGPVGQLPSWGQVGIGDSAADVDFGPASSYPEAPWTPADEEDQVQLTQASELESQAGEDFAKALEDGTLKGFEAASTSVVKEDSTKLLDQDGTIYGITTLEITPPIAPDESAIGTPSPQPGAPSEGTNTATAAPPEPTGEVVYAAKYDPGNPLGQARKIAAGAFFLFVLHLFGLNRTEKRAARTGWGCRRSERMIKRLRLALPALLLLSACHGGINGGGLTAESNGSIAFIALAGLLIACVIVLWIILGRED